MNNELKMQASIDALLESQSESELIYDQNRAVIDELQTQLNELQKQLDLSEREFRACRDQFNFESENNRALRAKVLENEKRIIAELNGETNTVKINPDECVSWLSKREKLIFDLYVKFSQGCDTDEDSSEMAKSAIAAADILLAEMNNTDSVKTASTTAEGVLK